MSPLRPSDPLRDHPLPVHDDSEDKTGRGAILVVAGSERTPGAAVLAGTAALRAGAGKLKIATSAPSCASVGVVVPEALVMPISDASGLAEAAGTVDAVLVGPGLMDDDAAVVRQLAEAITDATLVVDAGSLGELPDRLPARTILMPNETETDDMLGMPPDAAAIAKKLGAVVAVRGDESWVASPDGEAWCDTSGTVGLATSGSGDVAAGLMAGFAARGADPVTAALWGVRVHGVAGERLAERIGRVGFLARDLLDEIPATLSSLDDQ